MLTRRGWSLVGAAIGLFIGGRLLGLVELAVLAVATVLALIGADVWVRLHPAALGARRSLRERLQVGHEVVAPPEVGGLDLDRDHPQVRARVEPSGEFLTLREYAPGDDLRHVHWRSTARHDHVMVRQNEARRRAPVLVLLDVRPNA